MAQRSSRFGPCLRLAATMIWGARRASHSWVDSGIRSGEKGALDGCGASGVATQAIDFRRNSEGRPPPDDGAAILVVSRLGCRQDEACVTFEEIQRAGHHQTMEQRSLSSLHWVVDKTKPVSLRLEITAGHHGSLGLKESYGRWIGNWRDRSWTEQSAG